MKAFNSVPYMYTFILSHDEYIHEHLYWCGCNSLYVHLVVPETLLVDFYSCTKSYCVGNTSSALTVVLELLVQISTSTGTAGPLIKTMDLGLLY